MELKIGITMSKLLQLGGDRGLARVVLISTCLVQLQILTYNVAGHTTLHIHNISSTDPPPSADIILTDLFPKTTFHRSLYTLWSPNHAEVSKDELSVKLRLDYFSGCAIKSIQKYYHGFFSASIKLPGNYSAGVVTTFYMSNNEAFPKNHDEFDFEFLGTIPGEPYTIQTNIYGNGVTHIGREQRFRLWFDPTESFHNYSFLWTANHTVFFVDNIPVWEFPRMPGMGAQYPSKQMSLYATIWDASRWATDGGRYKVNYDYQPFIATYSNFILSGCPNFNPSTTPADSCPPIYNEPIPPGLTKQQLHALHWVQLNHRFYSYCRDIKRYPDIADIPECAAERAAQNMHMGHVHSETRSTEHTPTAVRAPFGTGVHPELKPAPAEVAKAFEAMSQLLRTRKLKLEGEEQKSNLADLARRSAFLILRNKVARHS